MGKRVSVKRQQIPRLRVGRLRDPAETTIKLFGLGIPLVLYGGVLGGSVVMGIRPVYLNFGSWLGLGLLIILLLSGQQKRKLLKDYPRSKVSGSSHQDVRLTLNRLCRLLDIKRVPDTYIIESQQAAATVRGLAAPSLIISQRLLEILSPREFEALLAALLGHVKAGNVTWRTFITLVNEMNGLFKTVCAPYLLFTTLLRPFQIVSHHSADRIALLLLDGDYRLLSRTLLKVLSYTTQQITEEQRQQLQAFLSKTGLEASASDVEQQYIVGIMLRQIEGLRDRLDNLKSAGDLPQFQEQLAIMRERVEKLQPAARG